MLASSRIIAVERRSLARCFLEQTAISSACTNADCSAFPGATCDTSTHLCIGKSSGTAGGGSCVGDAGCYACTPKTTDEFLNACTSAKCQGFDAKRLTHLRPDGGLPPLP